MFGSKSSSSASSANGYASGGIGEFSPSNNINLGGGIFPSIDLTDPMQMASLAFLGFSAYWAWKKFK
jgi:hypothetical protein